VGWSFHAIWSTTSAHLSTRVVSEREQFIKRRCFCAKTIETCQSYTSCITQLLIMQRFLADKSGLSIYISVIENNVIVSCQWSWRKITGALERNLLLTPGRVISCKNRFPLVPCSSRPPMFDVILARCIQTVIKLSVAHWFMRDTISNRHRGARVSRLRRRCRFAITPREWLSTGAGLILFRCCENGDLRFEMRDAPITHHF
jgi:hypothetical protein